MKRDRKRLKRSSPIILSISLPTAMLRMSGAISKSTDVMHAMQQLIRLPDIRDSMMELSKEMTKVCDACQ